VVLEESADNWDNSHAYTPFVIFDSGVYHMWYSGRDATNYRIGYATSPDGITWTKKPSEPVLDNGLPMSWEEWYVNGPSVIFNGTTYQMWYTGSNGLNGQVGYATSNDGISWTKSLSNPVLNNGPTSWDSVHAAAPSVVYDGILYHMWYHGFDGSNWRIGYATSPDGILWTKGGSNPVMDLGSPGDWDEMWVHDPNVIFDGVTYHMWFGGYDGVKARIGYATSPDGINWSPYAGNLCSGTSGDGCVFDFGPFGAWDYNGIEDAMVVFDGNTYMMWYSGHDGSNSRIGFATSIDGINWTRYSGNPVLDLGPSGYWDDLLVHEPAVVIDDSTTRMWYAAHDGTNARIGYAVMHYWRTGNFTSSIFDSGSNGTTWNSINWTESLPPGTNITMATRTGNTSIPDASWSPWSSEMWNETGTAISAPRSRYVQYRVTFITANRSTTPILSDVNINYDPNTAQPPTLTSPTNDLWISDNMPTFSWIYNDAEGDSQVGFTVQIDDDPSFASMDYTSGDVASGNTWWTPSLPIADGIWYWRVRTRDSYDLWSTYSGYWIVKIDTTPPLITNLVENPNPQEVYGNVNITANVTDITLRGVWINISGEGNFSMTFDPISGLYFNETSYSTLNTYSYTIWANDTFNRWSSASSSFVIHDTTPPAIAEMLETPNPQEIFGNVNITANVTDNYALYEVWINISGEGNFSMTFDSISELHYYEAPYSDLGPHSFTIWANDTSDNWASASSSFVIHDTTPPEIKDLVEDPDPQETNKNVRISANITDNFELDEVWIDIVDIGNFSMIYDSNMGEYFYNRTYHNPDTYSYTIWAKDTSDNWNSESSTFVIEKPVGEKGLLEDWWWILLIILIIILIIINQESHLPHLLQVKQEIHKLLHNHHPHPLLKNNCPFDGSSAFGTSGNRRGVTSV
jgi:predicted GH43/DUF377 family glycosyl hydrolase